MVPLTGLKSFSDPNSTFAWADDGNFSDILEAPRNLLETERTFDVTGVGIAVKGPFRLCIHYPHVLLLDPATGRQRIVFPLSALRRYSHSGGSVFVLEAGSKCAPFAGIAPI